MIQGLTGLRWDTGSSPVLFIYYDAGIARGERNAISVTEKSAKSDGKQEIERHILPSFLFPIATRAPFDRAFLDRAALVNSSELTQQDGRGKKTADVVWQSWQYFCLKKQFTKLHLPLNRSFCKRPENINVKGIPAKKLPSNSPVLFVTHKRFGVLFFLSSGFVNSLVSLRNITTEKRGRQNICVWHKRDRVVIYLFCHDLNLTFMFPGLLRKDLFKGG